MSSKLEQMRRILERKGGKVFVAGQEESNYLLGRKTELGFGQIVIIFLAPRPGLYSTQDLQTFMDGLFDSLQMSRQDRGMFRRAQERFHTTGRGLEFGILYVDERIGTTSIYRELTLPPDELIRIEGFFDGQNQVIENEPIMRRTIVKVYPNAEIAQLASQGQDLGWISHEELEAYRRRLITPAWEDLGEL